MNQKNNLHLIGWSGYPQLNEVFQAFKNDTGIDVNFTGYRNQDDMLAGVKESQASESPGDIASPTTDRLISWMDAGLIQSWNDDDINFTGIAPQYRVDQQTLINGKRMGSPNLWGSAGIGYHKQNASMLAESASLIDLFDSRYAGKLTMREDTALVAAGRALELQGGLPHGFDESYADENKMVENYDVILDFLISKKSNVAHFWFSEDEAQAAFLSEDCSVGYLWDTTVKGLQKQGLPIGFTAPVEGANCYLQNFVLLSNCKNKDQANTWVSWINTPKGGAMYAKAYGAFSPAQGAIELMDSEDRNFFESAYPKKALENLWWQPEQKPWFVKRRKVYALAYKNA